MATVKKKEKQPVRERIRQGAAQWVRRDLVGWLLLLPSLFCFIFFLWQPLINGVRISFYETRGFDTVRFIGLENYVDVITNSSFINAALNTLKYGVWSIMLGLLVPIIAAVLLNEVVHAKGFFRFGIYFPCMVPGIVTSVMWTILLEPDAQGMLNYLLGRLGVGPFQFLQDPNAVVPIIVMTMTWGASGSTAILYLADLQSVNTSLYEAVEIDGGGILQKFLYVTVPHMSGMVRMMFIMQIISVLQVFQQPFTMTGGGPNGASETLGMVAYNYASITNEAGKAAATSMILGGAIMIFSIVYMNVKKKDDTQA